MDSQGPLLSTHQASYFLAGEYGEEGWKVWGDESPPGGGQPLTSACRWHTSSGAHVGTQVGRVALSPGLAWAPHLGAVPVPASWPAGTQGHVRHGCASVAALGWRGVLQPSRPRHTQVCFQQHLAGPLGSPPCVAWSLGPDRRT